MPRPDKRRVADLIVAAAAAYPAVVRLRRADQLTVTLTVQHVTDALDYKLRISAADAAVRVREETPQRLPAFCPERHINQHGWFCLEFEEVDAIRVTDAETATAWWARLWKFLYLQRSAGRMRRWPNDRTWAHGDAASYQLRAEACAETLGAKFSNALALSRLRTDRRRAQPSFVALYDGEEKLYSVWIGAGRVATVRQLCFCGSKRPLFLCNDHAARAAELVGALESWRQAEREFWRTLANRACCGSMDRCPLKTGKKTSSIETPITQAQAA